jgi:hypothetical protein
MRGNSCCKLKISRLRCRIIFHPEEDQLFPVVRCGFPRHATFSSDSETLDLLRRAKEKSLLIAFCPKADADAAFGCVFFSDRLLQAGSWRRRRRSQLTSQGLCRGEAVKPLASPRQARLCKRWFTALFSKLRINFNCVPQGFRSRAA